jgi:hypothetical protein
VQPAGHPSSRRCLRTLLASPRAPLASALLSVLLCTPALSVGWQIDDHVHQ